MPIQENANEVSVVIQVIIVRANYLTTDEGTWIHP